MTTIGIIGAGKVGSAFARRVIELGYDVVISNSRGPETLGSLVEELGPKARAATQVEAAAAGDFALVSVPLKAYKEVPVAELAGKIVLDTINYYPENDGHYRVLDNGTATTSGLLQEHLPTSRVVKAFNHIPAENLAVTGKPGDPIPRHGLTVSSDHPDAVELVTDLYDALNIDAVNIGNLSESWRAEVGQPAYKAGQTKEELVANLALATRDASSG